MNESLKIQTIFTKRWINNNYDNLREYFTQLFFIQSEEECDTVATVAQDSQLHVCFYVDKVGGFDVIMMYSNYTGTDDLKEYFETDIDKHILLIDDESKTFDRTKYDTDKGFLLSEYRIWVRDHKIETII